MADRKAHFFVSPWPIKFDGKSNLEAVCGKVVEKPILLCVWDDVPTGQRLETLNKLGDCQKCIDKIPQYRGTSYIATGKALSAFHGKDELNA